MWEPRCLFWPLICWDIFYFSSATAERNLKKLDRKQVIIVFYHICVFFFNPSKNKGNCPGISVSKRCILSSGARYVPLWALVFSLMMTHFLIDSRNKPVTTGLSVFRKCVGVANRLTAVGSCLNQAKKKIQYKCITRTNEGYQTALQHKNPAFWFEITVQIQMWIINIRYCLVFSWKGVPRFMSDMPRKTRDTFYDRCWNYYMRYDI